MSYSSAMPEDCDEPRKKSGGGAVDVREGEEAGDDVNEEASVAVYDGVAVAVTVRVLPL